MPDDEYWGWMGHHLWDRSVGKLFHVSNLFPKICMYTFYIVIKLSGRSNILILDFK